MSSDSLLAALKTTLQKTKIDQLTNIIAEEGFSIKEVIDLTFHHDTQIGFRAAWILEQLYTKQLQRFLPQAEYFLDRFAEQNNYSAQRHYSKILVLMTKKNAPIAIKTTINNYDTAPLVETVFNWLINEKVSVAVKSFCLNILANFATKHNWIKEELLQTMDFLVDKESIGFYSKVKQIRKQLVVGR